MKVLSLFDGMSCGRIALERAGIPVEEYRASEVDKYAIEVSRRNYPDIIQMGDVTKVGGCFLRPDLLIAGSPCQGFSFAGKQLNFDDPRSKLFFEFVRILKECKPKYFLLENVKMKQEFQDIISDHLGVEPILINSCKFSAQNRERLYWTNINFDKNIIDKGEVLSDIIDENCEYELRPMEEYFKKRKVSDNGLIQIGLADIKGYDSIKRVYAIEGKSSALQTATGGNREPKIGILQYPRGKNEGGLKALNGKVPTLTRCSWQHNNHITDGYKWRKVSPTECERLQTVPDGYTEGVSKSQRYQMLGNGWTVDVIAHIFRGMK